ncbi:MAG: hypothetical protein OXC10_08640 [Rhodospirillaceae bacterium]|nr:hypothetical protein [Rhodospirillaceae bacterium]
MYSESDIDAAVKAGALTPEAAAALRDHVARRRAAPAADEEHFRLITGFNDIFVVVAAVLVLVAVGWIGTRLHGALGGAGVGLASWALAEYFTRRRRMALPSIVLLLTFAGGAFWCAAGLLSDGVGPGYFEAGPDKFAEALAPSALVAALAAGLHWWRFRVPITMAAGAAALVGTALGLILRWMDNPMPVIEPVMFVAGLGVFAFAMRWDLSDTARTTRRSDVAFWLHLLAAPLMVHPVFSLTASGIPDPSLSAALVVILYAVVGVVALAIDRRALLVSALIYLLTAVYSLFRDFDDLSLRFAAAALIVGAVLLLLSAFWRNARAVVVHRLPTELRARLPAASA